MKNLHPPISKFILLMSMMTVLALSSHAQPFAYVANTVSDNISVIDLSTNTVVQTIPTDITPVDLALSPDSTTIGVTCAAGDTIINGIDTSFIGTLRLLDLNTNQYTTKITTADTSGSVPSAAVYSPDGLRLYQSFLSQNRIEVFDLAGNTLTDIAIPVGPSKMAVRPGTNDLYVVMSAEGALRIVDLTNNTVSTTPIVLEGAPGGISTNPFSLAFTPNGNSVVVPNSSSFYTNVVDLSGATPAVSRVQEFFFDAFMSSPFGVAVTPDGTKALVTEEASGELSIVDLNNNNNIGNIVSFGFTSQPIDVSITPDGTKAVVSLTALNQVAIVDLVALTFTTVNVGTSPRRIIVVDPPACPATAVSSSIATTICDNQTFSFGGQNLNTAGTYRDTVQTSAGCDSVIVLTLTVNPTKTSATSAAICSGDSFSFGTQTLTAAGTYTEVFQTVDGCDSTVTLTLTVNPTRSSSASASICSGDSFSFGTQTLTTAGTYTEIFQTVDGCDSTVTLTLTVNPTRTSSASASICNGASFSFGTQTLTTAGTYTEIFQTTAGCDSTVTLTLSVNPVETTNLSATICSDETFTFGGQSLSVAGTYRDTLATSLGCDSILILSLTVNPVKTTNLSATICDNQTFAFGGQNLNVGGMYRDTLATSLGCDSILVLSLTVNPTFNQTFNAFICSGQSLQFGSQTLTTSGTYMNTFQSKDGCDSMVILMLTVGNQAIVNLNAAICAGDSFPFSGQSLTTAGVYRDTSQTATGCDSINVLTLTVNPVETTSISASICDNESFNFGGQTLTAAGTYVDTLMTSNGCDSIVTLALTVLQTRTTNLSVTICSNQTFSFGGATLNMAGFYRDTLTTVEGCDSVLVLDLTVNPSAFTSSTQTICTGDTAFFGNQPLTTAGVYTDTLSTNLGCDSILELTLIVNPTAATAITETICAGESISFGGQTLGVAGIYQDTLSTSLGCDSVITLDLIVNPTADTMIMATICSDESFDFNGQFLNTAGLYVDTLPTFLGCDSIITLDLTVNPTTETSISATICDNETFDFNGQVIHVAGTYRDTLGTSLGCDSVVILDLSVNPTQSSTLNETIAAGQTYDFNGVLLDTTGTYIDTLQTVAGCDSVLTLNLTVVVGLPITRDQAVEILPNPFGTYLMIESELRGPATYTLYDLHGKAVLMEHVILDGPYKVDLPALPKGVYTIWVEVDDKRYVQKLLKQ